MDQISTLERVFTYKAKANEGTLVAMRQFDDASPAKEIAIRVLNHTYAVDRIFAANLTGTEHGFTSPNPGQAPSLEELSAAIKTAISGTSTTCHFWMKRGWPSASTLPLPMACRA